MALGQRVIVVLQSILTWPKYFAQNSIQSTYEGTNERLFRARPELNEKVSLWQGDITTLKVDAIVNEANSQLQAGAGVCGVIHAAAGPELKGECDTLGGCPEGEAVITKGYFLPAKNVIHTVAPTEASLNAGLLSKCYQNILRLVLEKGLKSIAIPCIGTGIYGYPNANAAHRALIEVRQFLEDHHQKVDRIIFCVFLDEDREIYEQFMLRYFPIVEDPKAVHSVSDFQRVLAGESQPEALMQEDEWKKYFQKPTVTPLSGSEGFQSKV